jgi:hypothetical protein
MNMNTEELRDWLLDRMRDFIHEFGSDNPPTILRANFLSALDLWGVKGTDKIDTIDIRLPASEENLQTLIDNLGLCNLRVEIDPDPEHKKESEIKLVDDNGNKKSFIMPNRRS